MRHEPRPDRTAPMRRGTPPATRQRPLRDAETCDGEVSLQSLRGGNPMRMGAPIILCLFLRGQKSDVSFWSEADVQSWDRNVCFGTLADVSCCLFGS